MKTSKMLLPTEKSNNEEIPGNAGAAIFLRSILVILMMSWLTVLSSCLFPGPGNARHGERNEHHEHNERHGNGEHNGHDDHHDN